MIRPHIPVHERVLAAIALAALAWLGRRASARGDVHTSTHRRSAVLVANTSHADGWPCVMPRVYTVLASAEREGWHG